MVFHISDCVNNEAAYICDRLVDYNLNCVPKTQEIEFVNINKKMVDEDHTIIAGCLAKMYCWNVIYIDVLWVDENYRKCGLGTKLLNEIEDIARKENCTLIHLDTFDFQAKDFYIKHGYEIFGRLEGFPDNHVRYYLKKKFK